MEGGTGISLFQQLRDICVTTISYRASSLIISVVYLLCSFLELHARLLVHLAKVRKSPFGFVVHFRLGEASLRKQSLRIVDCFKPTGLNQRAQSLKLYFIPSS